MKKLMAVIVLVVLAVGCGGGSKGTSGGGAPIDPDGNWVLNAKDARGNSIEIDAVLFQTGSTVTAGQIHWNEPAGVPTSCYPMTVSFTNGTVQNVDQFSGGFAVSAANGEAETLTFTSTLTLDGLSTSGSYTSTAESACFPVATSGSINGQQVPNVTGSWSGTIQPCSYDSSNGVCTPNGLSSTISANLTQNDSSASVTGTYAVTNLSPFTNGSVSTVTGQQDFISGHQMQVTLTDANGNQFKSCCSLEQNRTYTAVVIQQTANPLYFLLTISH